jgi:hypothetical protein
MGVFGNIKIRRRIEEPSYGMPRIRSMTSKKDCHSEPSFLSSWPSFLSSRAKRLCRNQLEKGVGATLVVVPFVL